MAHDGAVVDDVESEGLSPLFLRLFPSSVFMQQSPGAVGGSLCPGAETGLGFAWTASSLSMGSWSSGKGGDTLAWTGRSWMYLLCYGSGWFRDSWSWIPHLDHGV